MSSDGPSKLSTSSSSHSGEEAEAEPLDDIILGEDEATTDPPPAPATAAAAPPPVQPKPSSPPPLRPSARPIPDRPSAPPAAAPPIQSAPPPPVPQPAPSKPAASSNRIKAAKRAKMTLRIPDDEISRPQLPNTTPSGGVPAVRSQPPAEPVNMRTDPPPPGGPPQVLTPSRPPSSPDDPPMPLVTVTGPPPPHHQQVRTNANTSNFISPDDTLELPQEETRARLAALTGDIALQAAPVPFATSSSAAAAAAAAAAAGIDASNERGWTPFQPAVVDDDPDDEPTQVFRESDREAMVPIQPTPIFAVQAAPVEAQQQQQQQQHNNNGNVRGTVLDQHEVNNSTPSQPPPVSEEIPVDMDLSEVPSENEIATSPRLPVALDSEEIKIEEGDRVSETGEVEVAPEDLVSVESLPSPGRGEPPPVKTAGKYPAYKPEPTPGAPLPAATPATIAAMQGVAPPAAAAPAAAAHPQAVAQQQPAQTSGSRPGMAAVRDIPAVEPPAPMQAQYTPTSTSPSGGGTPYSAAIAQAQAGGPQATPTPSPSTPQVGGQIARRQSNPLIFVPPVGALAPPPMTDTAAHRKKTRPWWEELFNDDFIRTMAKVTDHQIGKEVNFIEESLGCEAGAMILDLACGTGRHAVELAARGYQVVGFDLSLAMLARASDEAQDRKQKINFVQGDMREMTFDETFDGVYSWNTSFGYFDEEKNGAVIARVHKALKKGGQFLLDVVNRDYIVRQAPSLAWFEGDGCICMDEMTIDFITSRMRVKRTLMMDDGRTKEIEYSIRTYALHELGKMLHDNGFRVAEVSGRTGTPGVFFGCESPRTLILAEKR